MADSDLPGTLIFFLYFSAALREQTSALMCRLINEALKGEDILRVPAALFFSAPVVGLHVPVLRNLFIVDYLYLKKKTKTQGFASGVTEGEVMLDEEDSQEKFSLIGN